jgi:hypothetical protein
VGSPTCREEASQSSGVGSGARAGRFRDRVMILGGCNGEGTRVRRQDA